MKLYSIFNWGWLEHDVRSNEHALMGFMVLKISVGYCGQVYQYNYWRDQIQNPLPEDE